MSFKPMKLRDYKKWIHTFGWKLEKGGMDWKLYNQRGELMVRNIIIPHPPGSEVASLSVKKTRKALELEGLL
jgi:hypothetical protein